MTGRSFKARITENRPLHKDYNLLTLLPLSPMKEPSPGQFYMLGMEGEYDPLLKRPFSLLRKKGDGFQILYRIKGRGTAILRNMGTGSTLDVLGPLGNSYPPPEEGHTPLIIAGGIGMASLFLLAQELTGRSYIFYGARNAEELFFTEDLESFAKGLSLSTDDGSRGEKGTVVDVLRRFMKDRTPSGSQFVLYACGPRIMLEALSRIPRDKGAAAYVTMEENMACGIGACLGCAVKTVGGHKRVCKEGPVFPMDEIVW
ncbi:MAG TPA: dihydroorotate dehydrogenase electron transfer subunit [Thermodesulfovibrionales bacterium]|nr:dihydroorotate dehydrogenase electron transfer subunit [Thermodesulfovibrionales bacterium]